MRQDGRPTPAALGFAKKQGVEFEALGRKQTPKGEYLVFNKHVRGRSAADALPDLMRAVLRELAFPKQMHWDAMLDDGRGELLFGRPIRWLLFLYGGRVVPFTIGRAANAASMQVQDIESGALTYGHRFLATSGRAGRSIKVRSFEEYEARLKEHFVVLDHTERRERIVRALEMHARRLGGRVQLKEHTALIDEVADLVEYPSVVAGFFDRSFLSLPQEVLVTTLVHHQHYFPVVSEQGTLKEAFLAIVNTQPQDERVIAKNAERVVAARLRDAKFFWDADRKAPLESRIDRLHTVLFHKKLRGSSYRDKTERIERLAGWIATHAFERPDAAPHAAQAARLAKADLTTDMVFEFPELQGTMGGIYAREEGLPEQVWKAIYYHYLPVGVEPDAPPSKEQLGAAAVSWAAVSLADKLDTVVGLFAAGERPTGSRDPFGLRRNAHGAIRILMDLPELTGLDQEILLDTLLAEAVKLHAEAAADLGAAGVAKGFWLERVRYALEQRGFSHETVRAATSPEEISPLRARRVADALQAMRMLRRLPGPGRPLQACEEHRARADRRRSRGSQRVDGAGRARAARRARCAQPADRRGHHCRGLQASVHRNRGAPARGRSVLYGSVRHGRRSPRQSGTACADGGAARPDPRSRGYLGNRSSNGVGTSMAKKAARKQSRAKATTKRTAAASQRRAPSAGKKRSSSISSAAAKPTATAT